MQSIETWLNEGRVGRSGGRKEPEAHGWKNRRWASSHAQLRGRWKEDGRKCGRGGTSSIGLVGHQQEKEKKVGYMGGIG